MKLLYLVPNINNEGGVARVLSIKTWYLIEKWGYEIHIVTQNKGNAPLFFNFHPAIAYHDISLKGTGFSFLKAYKKEVNQLVLTLHPDHLIVCDNGVKAFLLPFLLSSKVSKLLEIHSSKYISEHSFQYNLIIRVTHLVTVFVKTIGITKFDKVIVESNESIVEWRLKEGLVIPNPLGYATTEFATLQSKLAMAVGRPNYEKGYDRMFAIWKKVVAKHPDWHLNVYANTDGPIDLEALALQNEVQNHISFFKPILHIEEKYKEVSIYLMTSRYEGFGMVLIEAMESGVPCIAYDCPCGPRSIITNNQNGYLVPNDNEEGYVSKVCELIENQSLRLELGKKAKESVSIYQIESCMEQWNSLFISLFSK